MKYEAVLELDCKRPVVTLIESVYEFYLIYFMQFKKLMVNIDFI